MVIQNFHDSLRDFLASGPSRREKHLEKFFKILSQGFWRLSLTICSPLTSVAKIACFTHWGSFSDQVSKLFIFPSHLVTIHLLVYLSLFQNHRVHTQTLHILPHFFTNLWEKVWILCPSQYISHFLFQISCIGCFDDLCVYDAWIWVFVVLMRLCCEFCWFCVVTLCLWLHNVIFVAHTHSMTWLRP